MHVIGATKGQCPLCKGEKERPLFEVRSPGYNGVICEEHLYVLIRQARKEEPNGDGRSAEVPG